MSHKKNQEVDQDLILSADGANSFNGGGGGGTWKPATTETPAVEPDEDLLIAADSANSFNGGGGGGSY